MKITFLFVIMFIAYSFTYAQDIIHLKNGTEIKAKVTEVTTDIVKYKKFTNPDGPTYDCNKSDVDYIKYQNNETDAFGPPQTQAIVQPPAIVATQAGNNENPAINEMLKIMKAQAAKDSLLRESIKKMQELLLAQNEHTSENILKITAALTPKDTSNNAVLREIQKSSQVQNKQMTDAIEQLNNTIYETNHKKEDIKPGVVGIGVDVSQILNRSLLKDLLVTGQPIFIDISFSKNFRSELELGGGSIAEMDGSSSIFWYYMVSFLGMYQYRNANLYMGSGFSSDFKSGVLFKPVVGGEYFISPKVSIGSEASIYIALMKNFKTMAVTQTSLLWRFYF